MLSLCLVGICVLELRLGFLAIFGSVEEKYVTGLV